MSHDTITHATDTDEIKVFQADESKGFQRFPTPCPAWCVIAVGEHDIRTLVKDGTLVMSHESAHVGDVCIVREDGLDHEANVTIGRPLAIAEVDPFSNGLSAADLRKWAASFTAAANILDSIGA